jgi:uncharacterized protein DUF1206
MRYTSTARPAVQGRRASDSPAARGLARAGLGARGVLYILIGWVAILVAFGKTSGHQASQSGALHLAKQPFGLVLLWLLGIGFAGYALWRLSEAAFGVTGEGTGAGSRLKSLVRGLVYGFFAYLTFQIIAGTAGPLPWCSWCAGASGKAGNVTSPAATREAEPGRGHTRALPGGAHVSQ